MRALLLLLLIPFLSGMVVEVTTQTCLDLALHRPADDVAYRPGVDVDGQAVAPADLPGHAGRMDLPDSVEIDITTLVAGERGQPGPRGEARFGTISIRPDGQVFWNGRLLHDPEVDAVAAACAELLDQGRGRRRR